MRILFVTPYLPSPPVSGGSMRMHGLISNIARRHEVAILAYKRKGKDVAALVEATGTYAGLVVVVEHSRPEHTGWQKRYRQVLSLLTPWSFERQEHRRGSFQRAFNRVVERWQPDAVVVEFAYMGFLRHPPELPLIVDAHNVEHEIVRRTAAIESSLLRRVYSEINARKLRREEIELATRVDGIATASRRDKGFFEHYAPETPVFVVPNGVDTSHFRDTGAISGDDQTLLFFGAMDYFPNADAILHFCDHIWPSLRSSFPDLRLNIVGRQPSNRVRALDGKHGVSVIGQVDDLRLWLEQATIVIVPLRAGSGTRLKIVESMAMGKPVVTTALGAEGLDVIDREHVLIADDPGQFAAAVSSLLGSPEDRTRIGTAARALAESTYDWNFGAEQLEQALRQAVSARRQVPPS